MIEDNRPKRGLGALLAATTAPLNSQPQTTDGAKVEPQVTSGDVPVLSIRRNPAQPRTEFEPVALQELADSIIARGLIQPVVVRPLKPEEISGDLKYELIAGERRWRASQIAGLTHIPVVVKAVFDERDILLLALVENLQRDDLNIIEEANAYDKLARNFNLTHDQVALGVGKSRAYISNSIRLLELPSTVLDAIKSKKLTTGHGKLLLSVPDAKLQQHLAAKTIAENLTVRELERLTIGTLSPAPEAPVVETPVEAEKTEATLSLSPINLPPRKKSSRNTRMSSPEVQDLERRLREHFGTKVLIEEGARRSRIVLEYFSNDDLNRIVELLRLDGDSR